jgi:hypothetical protein
VTLPPLVAAKLALYEAMREQKVSGADLAARIGMAEAAVRRLLDLDHRSHVDQVEAALRCLGKRLEVRGARRRVAAGSASLARSRSPDDARATNRSAGRRLSGARPPVSARVRPQDAPGVISSTSTIWPPSIAQCE